MLHIIIYSTLILYKYIYTHTQYTNHFILYTVLKYNIYYI